MEALDIKSHITLKGEFFFQCSYLGKKVINLDEIKETHKIKAQCLQKRIICFQCTYWQTQNLYSATQCILLHVVLCYTLYYFTHCTLLYTVFIYTLNSAVHCILLHAVLFLHTVFCYTLFSTSHSILVVNCTLLHTVFCYTLYSNTNCILLHTVLCRGWREPGNKTLQRGRIFWLVLFKRRVSDQEGRPAG